MENNEETRKTVGGFDVHPENINRNGRPPKGWTWRDLLIEAAEEIAEGSTEPKKKIMARKLVAKGLEGDVTALKEFGDRMDGKANQPLSGPDGGDIPVAVTVKYE